MNSCSYVTMALNGFNCLPQQPVAFPFLLIVGTILRRSIRASREGCEDDIQVCWLEVDVWMLLLSGALPRKSKVLVKLLPRLANSLDLIESVQDLRYLFLW